MNKPGRNDPCPCGSGKKYKKCCLAATEAQSAPSHPPQTASDNSDTAAKAHYRSGNAFLEQGKPGAAISSYRMALALKPDYAEAHVNLGNVLYEQGNLDEAIENFHKALTFRLDFAQAHYNLGNALYEQGRLGEAAERYRRTIALRPDFADAHNNLGLALQKQGEMDRASASYREALALKPDYAEAYSNLLFLYAYHAMLDPAEYLSLARNWERACLSAEERQAARSRTFRRPPPGGRRLKVGYVSGDFRQHAVSYFVEQLFARHDKTRIELFAYSSHGQRDAATERLQALAEHWIPVSGAPDAAVCQRIEADGIDVLVDLSGHTAFNRMGVFARRAAPVQAYYLGYFASTGLTEMDYWIGDQTLTPPETDSHFSERVWRLPRISMSYEGKVDAPLPGWQPDQGGAVRVGSFNNLGKLTPATLALWAKVLHALPQAGLLLKTRELADGNNRRRILDTMVGHGILPERIELVDGSATPGWAAHMACYDRLDIALDPVGGHGGVTTTCDALWMAVPVVALMGGRVTSRMTASMLEALGHPEWVARSEGEYVEKVVGLARNVGQRKALRSAQRDRMAASPLCDARDLAANLENAYFEMFQRWQERGRSP
ncbi:MAG: tetratricopeptide repeat protein [Nitrosomonadales bacterium]|nr:tetratricopeptide repeat protein [Nitrosomonadales bacterium]